MSSPDRASALRMLARGATGACAACGDRHLFQRGFVMRERCPRCGLQLQRTPGMWLGSIGLNTIVTSLVLFVVLVAGLVVTWPEPPVLPLTLLALAVVAVWPVLFFPISRTLWLAVDLAMRPATPEEFGTDSNRLAN